MSAPQFRAEFDARVQFSNGGHLEVAGFRVDLPSADVSEEQVATLFVSSLGLLMSERVDVTALRVFPEAHKGTRGGPSAAAEAPTSGRRLVELSSASTTIVSGHELSALPLRRVADLPTVVVRTVGAGTPTVDVGALAPFDVRGTAVLLHTGEEIPQLTTAGARWLADREAALVGVDGPAPAILRAVGIPAVEHLTGLDQLPPHGARFTATPPRLTLARTCPVRAFAAV